MKDDCGHKDCRYRSRKELLPTCDYLIRTGNPRGCGISECVKYEPLNGEEKKKWID